MEYKGYTARVEFDHDAGVLFGEVEGVRDVITFEATDVKHLASAFRESVDDYLEMCAERGEDPQKPYSGKFLVRIDPRLHQEVSMAAARAGKSLNQFTSDLFRNSVERQRLAATTPYAPSPNARAAPDGQVPALLGVASPRGNIPPMTNAGARAPMEMFGEQATRNTPSSVTPGKSADSRTPQPSSTTKQIAA